MTDRELWSVVIRAVLMVLKAIDKRFDCKIWKHD
jgi:hypothetical protein